MNRSAQRVFNFDLQVFLRFFRIHRSFLLGTRRKVSRICVGLDRQLLRNHPRIFCWKSSDFSDQRHQLVTQRWGDDFTVCGSSDITGPTGQPFVTLRNVFCIPERHRHLFEKNIIEDYRVYY